MTEDWTRKTGVMPAFENRQSDVAFSSFGDSSNRSISLTVQEFHAVADLRPEYVQQVMGFAVAQDCFGSIQVPGAKEAIEHQKTSPSGFAS
jgi:hypothetical protein